MRTTDWWGAEVDELPPYILFLYIKKYKGFITSFLFLREVSHKIHTMCCELVKVINRNSSTRKSQTTIDPTSNPFHLPSLLPLFSGKYHQSQASSQPPQHPSWTLLHLCPIIPPVSLPADPMIFFRSFQEILITEIWVL